MQSDIKLAEAAVVSLKSQTDTCNSELHAVESQLSSWRVELQQLDVPLQTGILSYEVYYSRYSRFCLSQNGQVDVWH